VNLEARDRLRSGPVLETPAHALRYARSMEQKSTAGLENSGTNTHQQVLAHLHRQSLGDPACQVCNESLIEGDQLTLYLYKPAGSSGYSIGQCRCRRHDEGLTTLFTRGVRELIVEGRVGQCRDHATQQTWAVLISPNLTLISASDTTTGRTPVEAQPETSTWNHGEQLQARVTDGTSSDRAHPTSQSNQLEGSQ